MKRLVMVAIVLMVIVGCNSTPNQPKVNPTVAVELAAFNVGYFVGKDKPAMDAQLRNAYLFARDGRLPAEAVAQGLAELKLSDPLLAGNALIVLKAMGANFAVDGQLSSLSNIPPELWDAAKAGYIQGFAIGQVAKK